MAKPVVLCLSGNISPTNALNGSIEILIDASNNHNKTAATHNAATLGNANNANAAKMAPTIKYGLLLPNLPNQVLSLMCPMMGCMINPVKGAAIQRIGISSIFAPRV